MSYAIFLLNNKTEISNGSMTNITYTTAVWSEGTPSGNLFVAPKTGWYFLAAEGAHESDGTDGKAFQVKLRCNGDITMSSSGIISGTMIAAFVAGIAHLNKGDIVRPYVHIANANVIFAFRGKWALLQSE